MIELIRTLIETSFSWLLIAQFAAILTALAFPFMQKLSNRCQPRERALSLLIYGLIAPFVAAWVITLYLHPTLAAAFLPAHCHHSDCNPHTPLIAQHSIVGSVMASTAFLLLLALVVGIFKSVQRSRQKLLTLEALSRPPERNAEKHPFRVIESTQLLAWCSGLWKPKIFVSRGMLNRLDRNQLDAVLCHELCHAKRGDNLRKSILHLTTLLWPKPMRKRIRSDFNAACEAVCDEEAAFLKSKSMVADVIRMLQPQSASEPSQLQRSSFAACEIQLRLNALESPPNYSSGVFCWSYLLLLLVAESLLFSATAHHLLEWITH